LDDQRGYVNFGHRRSGCSPQAGVARAAPIAVMLLSRRARPPLLFSSVQKVLPLSARQSVRIIRRRRSKAGRTRAGFPAAAETIHASDNAS